MWIGYNGRVNGSDFVQKRFQKTSAVLFLCLYLLLILQCAKKYISSSLGLVDFPVRLDFGFHPSLV